MSAGGPDPRSAADLRWRQLALDFRWDAGADLDLFVADGNEQAPLALRAAARPAWAPLYLAGAPATGKSHLLQAACGIASAGGATAVYVPLAERAAGPPAQLDGLEAVGLVALDGLEHLAGRPDWEEAVFHCHNRLREAGGQLLVAARGAPGALGLALPDLVSRLQAMLRVRLQPVDDQGRLAVLRRHAARRGLDLPAATARYLLGRERRDLPHLLDILGRLDAASLRAGRRLTVPFVRAVLAGGEDGAGAR